MNSSVSPGSTPVLPEKKIKTVPKFLFNLGTKSMLKQQKKNNIEGGLYMPRLCDIQYGELYIDKNLGSVPLGVTEDDIDAAIDDYEALRRYP